MIINAPKPCHQEALRQLWKEAFGDDDGFLDGFFSVGFSRDRCLCLWQDTVLCAALYWFDCTWNGKKVAYLYAVATDAANRGKGYCHALMEATHNLLKEQNYAGAILVPGSESLFRFYEKIGYTPCCPVKAQAFTAAGPAASVKKITATEYARLQKSYLPATAVFHKQQTLAFAATFSAFYQAEGCAFCGGLENDTFYFQEFLGDPEGIPSLLSTLNAKKGIARIPGQTPFAMYLPLNQEPALPERFDIPLN